MVKPACIFLWSVCNVFLCQSQKTVSSTKSNNNAPFPILVIKPTLRKFKLGFVGIVQAITFHYEWIRAHFPKNTFRPLFLIPKLLFLFRVVFLQNHHVLFPLCHQATQYVFFFHISVVLKYFTITSPASVVTDHPGAPQLFFKVDVHTFPEEHGTFLSKQLR